MVVGRGGLRQGSQRSSFPLDLLSLRQLARVAAARIGTINSVCGRLVSDFAFVLGLSRRLRVIDETRAASAVERSLAGAASEEDRERHLSGRAFESGVEEHVVEGIPLRVYSAAKTVDDCFKFRNKIGLDVALEALGDYRRTHRAGLDELWRCAKTVRVGKVMRPYLEAVS